MTASRCSTSITSRIRHAGTDANFVLTSAGGMVEVQATAEGAPFDEETMLRLLRLARIGCNDIFAAQLKATGR